MRFIYRALALLALASLAHAQSALTTSGVQNVTGKKTFSADKLCIGGSTSGAVCLRAAAIAGSGTLDIGTGGTLGALAYLGTSGVSAGSYTNASITVDAYGRVTAASDGSSGAPNLTATEIAFGDGSNVQTSSPNLKWLNSSLNLSVGGLTAGQGNASSINNTAFGVSALSAATAATSGKNSAFGYEAAKAVTSGAFGVAEGYRAATATTTSTFWTAVGYQALKGQTSGQTGNTAIGANALSGASFAADSNTAVGNGAGSQITSGSSNTMIGADQASPSTGAQNTMLGAEALIQGTLNNQIVIGYTASNRTQEFGPGANSAIIGNSSVTTFQLGTGSSAPSAITLRAKTGGVGNNSNDPGGNFTIQSGRGTGTGTTSSLIFQSPVAVASGSTGQTMTTGLTVRNGVFISTAYTVSTLPSSPGTGARAHVTDATSCTFLGALTGSGSTFCPVVYNGSAWVGG